MEDAASSADWSTRPMGHDSAGHGHPRPALVQCCIATNWEDVQVGSIFVNDGVLVKELLILIVCNNDQAEFQERVDDIGGKLHPFCIQVVQKGGSQFDVATIALRADTTAK